MTRPVLTDVDRHGAHARAVGSNLLSAMTDAGLSLSGLSRATGIPRTSLRRKLTTGLALMVNDVAQVCWATGADLVAAFADPSW